MRRSCMKKPFSRQRKFMFLKQKQIFWRESGKGWVLGEKKKLGAMGFKASEAAEECRVCDLDMPLLSQPLAGDVSDAPRRQELGWRGEGEDEDAAILCCRNTKCWRAHRDKVKVNAKSKPRQKQMQKLQVIRGMSDLGVYLLPQTGKPGFWDS